MKNSLGLMECASCYLSSEWNILTKCGLDVYNHDVYTLPQVFSSQGKVHINARHLCLDL